MASIREYFEKDFPECIRVHGLLPIKNEEIEINVLYDFTGLNSFSSFFIQQNKNLDYFFDIISILGKCPINLDKNITLPSVSSYHGSFKITNNPGEFEIFSKFYGESDWISSKNITSTGRIFFYSETYLSKEQIIKLKINGKRFGFDIQFRGKLFMEERNSLQIPLAFISHDSRDKEEVARKIAINLQNKLCPVWYDEFSLNVGDNLRTSIEKGIRECKKCVLVLSPNFFSNNGWGKTEFDSIFTRQILEQKNYILPVWYNVSQQDVYAYSPSLLNTFGLNWNTLGENEVCSQLYKIITK